MFSFEEIKEILESFSTAGTFVSFTPIDEGHINNTLRVEFNVDGKSIFHLLQQINTEVFKNPDELMANVDCVTSFLRDKVIAYGGNPERETLYCKPTRNGKKYIRDSKNRVWRLYNFVDNSFSYNSIESPDVFYKAGAAFGTFQKQLADFPIDSLYETIPDFHHTAKRYRNLMNAVKNNKAMRVGSVQKEIEFAKARRDDTYILTGLIDAGALPLRVTHNDTKLNNILFDKATNEPVCVVDLDTVMPGLSLYDFGDAIRFGANTAAEDEKDLSKVSLDLNLYEQYVKGYLSTAGESLSETEIEYMPLAAKMMTFECGMRFLTDYIDGDVYFRIAYPEHNLDRCHTQFALVKDMEDKFEEMKEITAKAFEEICKV